MSRSQNESAAKYFSRNVSELTPGTVQGDARILYVPVSANPGITESCLLVLSLEERKRAGRFAKQSDQSLFIQRRAFRRYCAALALESSGPLSEFNFVETEEGRPYLSGQPQLWFSFSSCRSGFLGAWSSTHGIGVDIEDQSRRPVMTDLARHFFSTAEADYLAGLNSLESTREFFRFWTLKEAALKSVGQGLPLGMNAFEFELEPELSIVRVPSEYGVPTHYAAWVTDTVDRCSAFVIKSRI